jgi:hypothetical protein
MVAFEELDSQLSSENRLFMPALNDLFGAGRCLDSLSAIGCEQKGFSKVGLAQKRSAIVMRKANQQNREVTS